MKTDLLRTALPPSTDWHCDLGHIRSVVPFGSSHANSSHYNHEERELQWFSKFSGAVALSNQHDAPMYLNNS